LLKDLSDKTHCKATCLLKTLKSIEMKYTYLILGMVLALSSCGNNRNADKVSTNEALKVDEVSGQEYPIVKENSELFWRGTKPAGQHTGTVDITKGFIYMKDNEITGGSFIIDLNTIVDTDLKNPEMNAKLVNHLKSADFFDVANFPFAGFEIVSLESYKTNAKSENNFEPTHLVNGNLSIKGITKNISFPVSISMGNNSVIAISEEFAIDRTLWNVNFKSKSVFAEFKDDFIGDFINLRIETEFKK
jgi:YceI-like domain